MESTVANSIEVNMEKDSSFVASAKRAHLKKYRRNMGHYQKSLRESGEKVEKGYGYNVIHSEGRGFTPFGDAFLRLGGGLGVEGCRHVRPKLGQP